MSIVYAFISVFVVSLLSLLGVVLLFFDRRMVNRFITYALAVSSGVLLGSVFFNLLPESIELLPDGAFQWVLIGFVSFFALEKMLSWHHHIEGDHHGKGEKPVAYLTLIGDGVHNFTDGALIAGAFLTSLPVGITTTLAVIAHEIPHELSDFLILLHGGFTRRKALLFNFISATTAIVGTLTVFVLAGKFRGIERFLVPYAAGNFIYIAASDLIPELLKKRKPHTSFFQLVSLAVGIALVQWTQLLFAHV